MPLPSYLPMHPSAELSQADIELLCEWAEQVRTQLAASGIDTSRQPPPAIKSEELREGSGAAEDERGRGRGRGRGGDSK